MKKYIFLLVSSLTMLAGCRYKDGPAFSILSAKTRIARTWVIEKYSDNGNDQTKNFNLLWPEYALSFKKDMNYTLFSKGIAPFNENGKWEFQDNGTKFNLKKNNTGSNVWNITKLTVEELWANQIDPSDGHLLEYHLKAK